MSNHQKPHSSENYAWSLLSEAWIEAESVRDHQYIEKAMESVGWLGLGDLQEEQIQKDIQAAIKKAGNTRCQDASTLPLLIQIWTTGFDAADLCGGSLRSLDSPRKMQSGVGFFIIEKTIDGTENTPSETYRLVDVRIYG